MMTLISEKASKQKLRKIVIEYCNYEMSERDLDILYELFNKGYLKEWNEYIEKEPDKAINELDKRYDNGLTLNLNVKVI